MKIIKIVIASLDALILIGLLINMKRKPKKTNNLTFLVRKTNYKRLYLYIFSFIIISIVLIIIKKIVFSSIFMLGALFILIRSILLKKEKIVIKEGFIYKYNLFGKEKEKYDIKSITKIEENNYFNLTIYFGDKKINLYYDIDSYNLFKSIVINHNIEYIKNTM